MRYAKRAMRVGAVFATFATAGLTPAHAEPSTFDVTVLAASCANCHGTDGRSPGSIPTIAGRPESILNKQLKTFKADTPPAGTTIMDRLAKGLSDVQIDALARHFSQIAQSQTTQQVKQP